MRKAEIRNLHAVGAVQENVLRLEITVADAVEMEILKANDDLSEKVERNAPGKVAPGYEAVKEFAMRSVFKSHVQMARRLVDIEKAEYVRMIRDFHECYFTPNTGVNMWPVIESAFVDDLHRHFFASLHVRCKNNTSGRTGAQHAM
jgi:hypothetical protein